METDQPINRVEWVHRDLLRPNDYNPNAQPTPEHRLLVLSIRRSGWTQPIVVFESDGQLEIVDGEHRWRASADPLIYGLTDGLVPIVRLHGARAERMMATVRHNRARGEHGVMALGDLVCSLVSEGVPPEDIAFELQMEDEEVERLTDARGMPVKVSSETQEFSKGWVPE